MTSPRLLACSLLFSLVLPVLHAPGAAPDGGAASAAVTLGGEKEMIRHRHVSLVNEAGVYKVDKVKGDDR